MTKIILLLFLNFVVSILIVGLGETISTYYFNVSILDNPNLEAPRAIGFFLSFTGIALLIPFYWLWTNFADKKSLSEIIGLLNTSVFPQAISGLKFSAIALLFALVLHTGVALLPGFRIDFSMNVFPSRYIEWLAPMLIIIFLQSASEEILYRGILQNYFLDVFSTRWMALTFVNIIFGFMHFDPSLGAISFYPVFETFVFGMIMSLMAIQTSSLVGPIMVHFTINVFLVFGFSTSDQPSDLSIVQADYSQLSIVFHLIIMLTVPFAYYKVWDAQAHRSEDA